MPQANDSKEQNYAGNRQHHKEQHVKEGNSYHGMRVNMQEFLNPAPSACKRVAVVCNFGLYLRSTCRCLCRLGGIFFVHRCPLLNATCSLSERCWAAKVAYR